MSKAEPQDFAQRIEVIEAAYEYMLAYAAQGIEAIHQVQQNNDIRMHLESMASALDDLGEIAADLAELVDKDKTREYQDFLDTLSNDAKKTRAATRLVLARSGISSQLIDNLNASIHVRALLTDLFLLDEALKN